MGGWGLSAGGVPVVSGVFSVTNGYYGSTSGRIVVPLQSGCFCMKRICSCMSFFATEILACVSMVSRICRICVFCARAMAGMMTAEHLVPKVCVSRCCSSCVAVLRRDIL